MSGAKTETSVGDPTAAGAGVVGFESDLLDLKFLAKHKKQLPLEALRRGLRSAQLAVRANSAAGIGVHGAVATADVLALGVLLRDESASVRAAAARALGAAADVADALPKLLVASADPDAQVRADAAAAVAAFGADALPLLIAALQQDGEIADAQVIPHLAAHGKAAEPLLVAALDHEDERMRGNAVAGLIALGTSTLVAHQDRLQAQLNDPSKQVRELIREAMGALYRREHPSHLEPRAAPTATFDAGSLSAADVKKLAKSADEETLLHFARDGRAFPRRNAWRVMVARGNPGPYVTALAAVATRDEDAKVRALACQALASAHDEHLDRAVVALVTCSADAAPSVVEAAAESLSSLGTRAITQLAENLDVRDGDKAELWVAALVSFGQPAGKAVAAKIDHVNPVVRTNALLALRGVGGKALAAKGEALAAALNDTWDPARASVALALGELLPKHVKDADAAVTKLTAMYSDDASLEVRNACEKALRQIATRVAQK